MRMARGSFMASLAGMSGPFLLAAGPAYNLRAPQPNHKPGGIMAIASMTGFARAEAASGDRHWVWELRSVNGRDLDIRCRLPKGFDALDPVVRAAVAERCRRGNVSVTLTRGRQQRPRLARQPRGAGSGTRAGRRAEGERRRRRRAAAPRRSAGAARRHRAGGGGGRPGRATSPSCTAAWTKPSTRLKTHAACRRAAGSSALACDPYRRDRAR